MERRDLETVRYEKDGPVARVILNRPDKANAQNSAMAWDVENCLKDAEAESCGRSPPRATSRPGSRRTSSTDTGRCPGGWRRSGRRPRRGAPRPGQRAMARTANAAGHAPTRRKGMWSA